MNRSDHRKLLDNDYYHGNVSVNVNYQNYYLYLMNYYLNLTVNYYHLNVGTPDPATLCMLLLHV